MSRLRIGPHGETANWATHVGEISAARRSIALFAAAPNVGTAGSIRDFGIDDDVTISLLLLHGAAQWPANPGVMRRQFPIYPPQVEHRRDLADRVIIRHGIGKAERIENDIPHLP